MSERRAEDIGMSGYLNKADMEADTAATGEAAGGWIEWAGGERPVAENVRVEVRSAKGWTITADAWALIWANVVAYRVVSA